MATSPLTRRDAFVLFGGAVAAACGAAAARAEAPAEAPVKALVHRSPTCGCCGKWAERLKAAGFAVEVVNEPDMKPVKARLGVPEKLASCHTAEIGGYVIEGHVPIAAIERLLKEKPKAIGIAAPGMPAGSPGMETGGEQDVYEVVLFDASGSRPFAKFQGDKPL
jgi:hypothetical protein